MDSAIGVALGVCLALACFLSEGRAFAQTADETYKIGVGDLLKVDVPGRRDISGQYTVGPDGSLTLPIVGAVAVGDRTPRESAAEISRRISLITRESPRVTVTLIQSKSRKYFVLGSVLLPGTYSFREAPTAWDVVTEAGGPTEDADMSAVEIIPGDSSEGRTTKTVDLAAAIREGRVDNLEALRPGDTVRVPRGSGGAGAPGNAIWIFGAVGAQGPRPADQARDLLSALAAAGGPSPDANLKRVGIYRKTDGRMTLLEVNVDKFLGRNDPAGNPALEPGDTVYLHRLPARSPRAIALVGYLSTIVALTTSVIVLSNH